MKNNTNIRVTTDKKIELLKGAADNKLTEDTVKNLAKQIRKELIVEEKYEECVIVNKLEEEFINRFKKDRENMVRNVGLNKKELKKLLELL
ncbi:MAG: hypothetical protein Q8O88_03725 [bacterium]|nr:hypothetical protein [bacterium]